MNKIYDPKSDPAFQKPVIEVDEWRERFLPDGTRLPFRCLQGGFVGTGVRFSMFFPEKEGYRLRFYQCLTPESTEVFGGIGQGAVLALGNGAYYVESRVQEEIPWKASAAVAELSRRKARDIYGPGRFYGYVYSGEGNAYQALACIENASAWDGAVLVVPGTQTILYNGAERSQFVLAEYVEGPPQALMSLEDWVERGVYPQ